MSAAPTPVAVAPVAPAAAHGDGLCPADAATRGVWLWDTLFVASAVLTAVLVAVADQPVPSRVAAATLVLGLAGAWLVVGRRFAVAQSPDHRPAVLAYAATLVIAISGAVLLVAESTWALFVVLPQVFWLLRLSRAIVITVVLTPGLPLLAALGTGAPFDVAVGQVGPQGIFMSAFGVLVGVWIHRVTAESEERARLIEQLEASQAEVAELSHTAGVAAERERLAGEIHDTLAQGFTSIVTLLQAAQAEFDAGPDASAAARRHVELAVRSAKENLREARHLVAASEPGGLEKHSLTDAVGRQVERFADETGVAASHDAAGPPRRLPAEHEIVLLRAAQELLANVARHANARWVTVDLDFTDPHAAALTVADDGVGFDPGATAVGSYGLAMMRTRTERLGGAVTVGSSATSGSATGTRVTVRIPT